MENTYIVIADAHRARCFERRSEKAPLIELADFLSPHIALTGSHLIGDLTGAAGKGHGRTGHSGAQFERHIEVPDKERGDFAQQLADYLNEAVMQRRCKSLALIATSPMLGDLRPRLVPSAARAVKHTVAKDLTHYTGPELTRRVSHALGLSAYGSND